MPTVDFPGALPRWTQNYAARPPGYKIDLVVLHATAGPQPQDQQVSGTIAWFMNPDSQVSSHYLIGQNGTCYQFVPETLAAWHANGPGLPDYNSHSIGIELAQQAGHMEYTKPQLGALINLMSWLVQRYNLTPTQIVTHAMLNPGKTDPLGWGSYAKSILQAVFDPQAPHGAAQPAPQSPDPDAIRNGAYNAAGIAYNPQAAFPIFARAHDLGAVMTPEFSATANGMQIEGQGFAGGIVYCLAGDYGNVKVLTW